MKLAVRGRSTLTAVVAAVVLTVAPAGAALATGSEGGDHDHTTTTTTTTTSTTTTTTTTTTTQAPTTTTTMAPTTTTTSTATEPTSATIPPLSELPDVITACPEGEDLDVIADLTDDQLDQVAALLEETIADLDEAERAEFLGLTVEEMKALGLDQLTPEQLTDLLMSALLACLPVEETPSFTG